MEKLKSFINGNIPLVYMYWLVGVGGNVIISVILTGILAGGDEYYPFYNLIVILLMGYSPIYMHYACDEVPLNIKDYHYGNTWLNC